MQLESPAATSNSGRKGVAAVTGATGTIGPTLVERLSGAGYQMRILTEQQTQSSFFGDQVKVEVGDICDPAAVGRLLEDTDVVFRLAAKLHIPDPPPEIHAEYWRVNVEGTRNVVEQAVTAGVRRLVYISTVTVYGSSDGQVVDESALPQPDTIYSRTKLEGEQVALAAQRADDKPLAVVLRLATVYGPRQKGNFQRLVQALARGRFVPVGDGRNQRTLVYVRDAVEAMLLAAEHPKAAGQVFNVTDGCVHTMHGIFGRHLPGLGSAGATIACISACGAGWCGEPGMDIRPARPTGATDPSHIGQIRGGCRLQRTAHPGRAWLPPGLRP